MSVTGETNIRVEGRKIRIFSSGYSALCCLGGTRCLAGSKPNITRTTADMNVNSNAPQHGIYREIQAIRLIRMNT